MEPSEEKRLEFLEKYIKLSREYGLEIGACGCCDSPWVVDIDEDHQRACYMHLFEEIKEISYWTSTDEERNDLFDKWEASWEEK